MSKHKHILPPNAQVPAAAIGQPTTSKAATLGFSKVIYPPLSVITLICLFGLLPLALSQTAMICPEDTRATFVKLVPQPYKNFETEPFSPPFAITFSIYKANLKSIQVDANYCNIIRQHSLSYMGFSGSKFPPNTTQSTLAVSLEECKMMAMDKKCSFGNLVGLGEIVHTTNPLKN